MRALILVDLQKDFVFGGALPVLGGTDVVQVANELSPRFELVVATQDWHPLNHGSFAVNHPGRKVGDLIDLNGLPQILWPIHCVQYTDGAALLPGLDSSRVACVFQKGTDPSIDSYSGFFDNGQRRATGLGDFLKKERVDQVYVMGLATDYCVKFTALDALQLNFQTRLIVDGCRGVDLHTGNVDEALRAMESAGVRLVESGDVD